MKKKKSKTNTNQRKQKKNTMTKTKTKAKTSGKNNMTVKNRFAHYMPHPNLDWWW